MVYLQEYGGDIAQIWLPTEAYETVYYGNEMVHVRVNLSYQDWSGFVEQDYNEPWGV